MRRTLLFVMSVMLAGQIQAQDHDLAISRWLLPQTGGALDATETVRFEIENKGTLEETGFTVAFSVNGGVSFTEETFASVIPAGQKRTHTFAATADLSIDGASYVMVGKIILASDPNLTNNEIEVIVDNRIPGDLCDEPIVTGLNYYETYTDSRDFSFFNNDYAYNSNFTAPNYLSDKDIVYSFQSSVTYSCVDVSVHSNWAGNFNPGIALHVITACPEGAFSTVSRGYATGTLDAAFTDGFLYAAQTYYIIVSQRYSYDATYDLTVNLYQITDFKSFGFQSLTSSAEINYDNHTVVVTIPQGTNVTALTPEFSTSFYADAYIGGELQTSGSGTVDFTNAVNYSITLNINPYSSQEWTVSVVEGIPNAIESLEAEDITISPNPVISDLLVQVPLFGNNYVKVNVVNSIGTIVYTQSSIASANIILPLGHLVQGIYFVVIESDGIQVVKKFMKQ